MVDAITSKPRRLRAGARRARGHRRQARARRAAARGSADASSSAASRSRAICQDCAQAGRAESRDPAAQDRARRARAVRAGRRMTERRSCATQPTTRTCALGSTAGATGRARARALAAARRRAVPRATARGAALCVLGPGKRIRPALVYATAESLGVPLERVDAAACAVELIHAYSLVHDDLPAMDDDDLRRGRPTCHRRSTRRRPFSPAIRCRCSRSSCSRRIRARPPTPRPRVRHDRAAGRRERHRRAWPAARRSISPPRAAG